MQLQPYPMILIMPTMNKITTIALMSRLVGLFCSAVNGGDSKKTKKESTESYLEW